MDARTITARLLEIWTAVLPASTQAIGVDDDFLDLGGDSLAATRCINRVVAAFGVELPLEAFFEERTTILTLTARIEAHAAAAAAQPSRP